MCSIVFGHFLCIETYSLDEIRFTESHQNQIKLDFHQSLYLVILFLAWFCLALVENSEDKTLKDTQKEKKKNTEKTMAFHMHLRFVSSHTFTTRKKRRNASDDRTKRNGKM